MISRPLFMAAMLATATSAIADTAVPAKDPLFEVSISRMRLREAAQAVSDITGKTFSVSTLVTDQQVSMVCKKKMTRDQVYALFVLSLGAKDIRVSRSNIHALMKQTFGKGAQPLPDVEEVDARIAPLPGPTTQAPATAFVISEIRPNSLYDHAGLLDGDVIREINGKPVPIEAGPCVLVEALTAPQPQSLEIERVQRMTLSLPGSP